VTTSHENTGSAAQEPRLRASDVDRLATVRVLQDAVARGLLTPDEGSERMAAAFAAVHVADLGPLTEDLPAGRVGPTAPGWRPLARMAAEQVWSSLHTVPTGNLSRGRIAVALLIALTVLLLVGSIGGELFDGGDWHRSRGFDDD
jgi:hypothetical protein